MEKIHIIGAGISGLIAATVLEKNGFHPVIIEATDRPGGRLKTDIVDGYQLDHGFQVLLTAYPAAQNYLDFASLDLQFFLPGASIFKNKRQQIIGDPIKNKSLLIPTLFSGIGTLSDKLKIIRLNNRLKKKSLHQIFSESEKSTRSYLTDLGFSAEIITDFFQPFFSGIFLEPHLETSSRMFEFAYKMFGEGHASLPKSGIEAIPKQLFKNLNNTTFRFNTKVLSIENNEITLDDKTKLKTSFTIDATNLLSNSRNPVTDWKSCHVLYFETDHKIIQKKMIGLIPKKEAIINNIFYHTSLKTDNRAKKELLSVTVVDDKDLEKSKIIERVEERAKRTLRN